MLARLQRELADWIGALDGAPDAAALDARVRADRGVSAARRIDVYANAYFARLHDALRADYPRVAETLGEAAFHDLAKLYLIAHPPRSFTLRVLGARLPEFLRSPAAELFRERWPTCIDLAALDWAIADVFDAPDSPVLERAALAAIPAGDWPTLRFTLVAAQRRISFASKETLVQRTRERVHHRALEPAEARALATVEAGDDFAAVCAAVEAAYGDDPAAQVLGFLERWLADELLSAVRR